MDGTIADVVVFDHTPIGVRSCTRFKHVWCEGECCGMFLETCSHKGAAIEKPLHHKTKISEHPGIRNLLMPSQ